jgi:putative protein-disulfide isomerase
MKTNEIKNLMHCDPETGVCEIPDVTNKKTEVEKSHKPVRLLYFTDPICSTCWGIEPQLRKLKLEYGDYFDIEYRMGGLLKGWDSYGGKDVRNPTDVAQHWDEVSLHYDMPIDGDVWLEDPLSSSYPPSIAFKAAQLQDEKKAVQFLRRLREMVFVEKKNITRREHVLQAALETGLDVDQFGKDLDGRAEELFNEDLELARQWGVRGFPTIYFIDEEDNRFRVYGSKPYEQFEEALLKLVPKAIKKVLPVSYETVLKLYDSFTTKEFAVMSNKSTSEAEQVLEGLKEQQQMEKVSSKNGPLWRRK